MVEILRQTGTCMVVVLGHTGTYMVVVVRQTGTYMVVVLPAPLCPRNDVMWLSYRFSDSLLTAILPVLYTCMQTYHTIRQRQATTPVVIPDQRLTKSAEVSLRYKWTNVWTVIKRFKPCSRFTNWTELDRTVGPCIYRHFWFSLTTENWKRKTRKWTNVNADPCGAATTWVVLVKMNTWLVLVS